LSLYDKTCRVYRLTNILLCTIIFSVRSYDPLHTSLPGLEGVLKPFYERVFIIHLI